MLLNKWQFKDITIMLWKSGHISWAEVWKDLYNVGFRGSELNSGFLPKGQF